MDQCVNVEECQASTSTSSVQNIKFFMSDSD